MEFLAGLIGLIGVIGIVAVALVAVSGKRRFRGEVGSRGVKLDVGGSETVGTDKPE